MGFTQQNIIDLVFNPEKALRLTIQESSQLIHILRQQKLIALFAKNAIELSIFDDFPSNVQQHLKNSLVIIEQQNVQAENEVKMLHNLLDEISPFVVILKGAAYSICGREFASTRQYSDIDVLVTKQSLQKCEQAMLLDGWIMQEISSYDDRYYRKWAHELPPMQHMVRGTVVDLHHNIVPIISGDAPGIDTIERYVITLDSGLQVFTSQAQFVHSAVHLMRNEDYETGFRDLCDLFLMLNENDEVFVEEVISVAQDIGFAYETGLALYIVANKFDLHIDEALLKMCFSNKSKILIAVDKHLMSSVLSPYHSMIKGYKLQTLLHTFAIIRGHIIKMPFTLLVYHIMNKACRNIIQRLFGEHIFTPKEQR